MVGDGSQDYTNQQPVVAYNQRTKIESLKAENTAQALGNKLNAIKVMIAHR